MAPELPLVKCPNNKKEADRLDQEFVLELERLSLDERERIQFDVHGLGHVGEDPPSVDDKLKELETALADYEGEYALRRAKFFNQAYVDDRNFCLKFLRGCKFDVKLAAETISLHFERKLNLFGDSEILGREVLMSDLSGESLDVLYGGMFQIGPNRDVAGRAVEWVTGLWPENTSADNVGRAMWYFYMIALQDEANLKHGFVRVIYNYGCFKQGASFLERLTTSLLGLPGKECAVHYCTNDDSLMPFVSGVRQCMIGIEKFYVQPFFGSLKEAQFRLQTFGIPTQDSPMQEEDSWSLEAHHEWLNMQQAREAKGSETGNAENRIITPSRFDILFGRSKRCRDHIGNSRLSYLCETRLEEYESATKVEKITITRNLLVSVHESQGRFLKWVDDGWVEVDDVVAKEKISHFFRHLRSKMSTPAATGNEAKPKRKRRLVPSVNEQT